VADPFFIFLIYGSATSNAITLSKLPIIRLFVPYFEVIGNLRCTKEMIQFVRLMTSVKVQIYV
jgi:hypothetical protein